MRTAVSSIKEIAHGTRKYQLRDKLVHTSLSGQSSLNSWDGQTGRWVSRDGQENLAAWKGPNTSPTSTQSRKAHAELAHAALVEFGIASVLVVLLYFLRRERSNEGRESTKT